jgi:mannose-6-phosphate isomerase-like protein (cupin superfamily)
MPTQLGLTNENLNSAKSEERAMIQVVEDGGVLLAIILRKGFNEPGIHFFTPDELSQQLGYMRHPVGKIIEPHVHNHVRREVKFTQEVLFIRSGRLRVDFYNTNCSYLESYVLNAGDVILLASGGHGFEVLEEVEMVEVKQGPYAGDIDKTRFEGVALSEVKIRHQ